MNEVIVGQSGPVRLVRINRPQALNALTGSVLLELHRLVTEAADDDAIRAVVITGTGEKAFSVGADLRELDSLDPERLGELMRSNQQLIREIERAPVPVIAAVNGLALGGGFELVLACTFSVLSQAAALGLPETGIGLIPGFGGTQRLPRAIGPAVAAHLMLTGARLDADRAYQLRLTPVEPVAPGDLLTTACQIATQIADRGPAAVRTVLTALDQGGQVSLDDGLAAESELAIRAFAGEESAEGIAALFERRQAHFTSTEPAR
jgi:enoyl-CoA hydratase